MRAISRKVVNDANTRASRVTIGIGWKTSDILKTRSTTLVEVMQEGIPYKGSREQSLFIDSDGLVQIRNTLQQNFIYQRLIDPKDRCVHYNPPEAFKLHHFGIAFEDLRKHCRRRNYWHSSANSDQGIFRRTFVEFVQLEDLKSKIIKVLTSENGL